MDAAAVVSNIVSTQEVFLALATTLHMTAYLFPPQANLTNIDTFDYIVVGAGSAGSVVAYRLTEDKDITVLLVEAGDDPPVESVLPAYYRYLKNSEYDWNYTSVESDIQKCHKNSIIDLTRGKMLGGTSSLNYMHYVTGNPQDYNIWADIANDTSWNYDNVLPLIKENENLHDPEVLNSPTGIYHGTYGNIGVTPQSSKATDKYLKSFEELGYNITLDTSRNTIGFGTYMFTIADGVRQSTAYAFLRPAKDRPNLFVLKNALASKILFDRYKNAVGIEIINGNDEKKTFHATKEVIISAGVINSPQLLMLSGIGPKRHLFELGIPVISDLPVGENLQDHSPVVQFYPTDQQGPTKPLNPHKVPNSWLVGYVAENKSQPYPDFQVVGTLLDAIGVLTQCAFIYVYNDEICEKFYKASIGRNVLLLVTSVLHPKSTGKILLRSSNPKDYPLIDLGIFSNETDYYDAIKYNQEVSRIAETSYFKSVNSKLITPPGCEDLEPNSDEYWSCHVRCLVTTFYHYMGTCAMGSVVDSRLRVYGVQRLRVIDGSVAPTISSGNTNVPIIMIGQKGADMIKEDLKNTQ